MNTCAALYTMGFCASRWTSKPVETSWVYRDLPWWDVAGRMAYRAGWQKGQR